MLNEILANHVEPPSTKFFEPGRVLERPDADDLSTFRLMSFLVIRHGIDTTLALLADEATTEILITKAGPRCGARDRVVDRTVRLVFLSCHLLEDYHGILLKDEVGLIDKLCGS